MLRTVSELCCLQTQHAEERSSTTPIQALPPASALDLAVLDALPLHLKRELERAYGEGCTALLFASASVSSPGVRGELTVYVVRLWAGLAGCQGRLLYGL